MLSRSVIIAASLCLCVPALAQQEVFNVPLRICMGGVTTEDSFGRTWLGEGPVGAEDPLNIRPEDSGGGVTAENWSIAAFQPDSLDALGFDSTHPGDRYIFNTIRWDDGGAPPDFLMEIPVLEGTYTVNMYFNEGCCTNRHFKIQIQDEIVDDDVSYLDYDPVTPGLGRVGRLSFNDILVPGTNLLKIGLLPCPECPGGGDNNAIIDALEVISGPACDHQGMDFNCAYNPDTGEVTGTWNPSPGPVVYRILKNGQPLGPELPAGSSSFVDPAPASGGLVPRYTVQALSDGLVGDQCAASVKAYLCPRALGCSAPAGTRQVELSWTAGTASAGVTGYELRRNGVLLQTLPPGATSYSDQPTQRFNSYELTPQNGGVCAPLSCRVAVESIAFELPLRINMGGRETVDSMGNVWLGDGPGAGDPLSIRPDDRGGANWIENWALNLFQPDALDALGFDSTHPGDVYIFNTIRWDDAATPTDFRMEIPLPKGVCTVNMYFNEGCCTNRHFKIELQGRLVDDDVSYLDYDPALPSPGRVGRLTFEKILVEDGFLRVGLLPCPTCVGGGDNNAIINGLEILSTGPLPATVARDLSRETYGAGDTIDVALAVNLAPPAGDILVQDVVPDLVTVGDISDGGVLTGNTIAWDLRGITQESLTYKITPQSCAGDLSFGAASWKLGEYQGQVTGEAALARAPLVEKPLGPWQSADVVATGGGVEPTGLHDLLVSGRGAGVKLTKDEFRFTYLEAAGDFEISARIDCLFDPGDQGQAGLMVRDTLDTHSAHAFFSLSSTPPAGGGAGTLKGISRRETLATRTSSPITISNKDVAALPIYLKLKRSEGKITFQRSSDGVTYDDVASKDIGDTSTQVNLRNETLIGLVVTNGGAGETRATFSQVSGPEFKEVEVRPFFRRGDADGNAAIELTDAVKLLNYLFLGAIKPECLDAADVDDNGEADISDAISNLNYQFLGGPAPRLPGPEVCGPDPTEEALDLGCDRPCV